MDHNGISFVVNVGRSGGLYARFSRQAWRVCLWWVAFTLYFNDYDKPFYMWLMSQSTDNQPAAGGEE